MLTYGIIAVVCVLFSCVEGRRHVVPTTPEPSFGLPKSLTSNLTAENYVTFLLNKNCKVQKFWCTGGPDCNLITDKFGCQVCSCPIGSAARGCDKMPEELYVDLWINGCPKVESGKITRYTPQRITRYYRHIDKEKGIDECRYYESPFYPYCPELDDNMWKGPQTKEECQKLCFWRYP